MIDEEKMNYITEVDILDEAKDCFLTYAEEVLTDRAIPAAEDGLLSSQRKILWTMEDVLKMDSKGKTKKCQSLVGTTLSTAYYHGDASCYGVLCKMAQKYLMRYPLIHGQGNLGTQENNDMIASSRYTEAKPSVYTDLMMLDYKKNPVPLKETYNGEYMEPIFLPSFFPNALCNGRQAIGISMAHTSAPNNLTEVCNGIIHYIENPEVTIDDLMKDIKGPDFPLGGVVINAKDVREAYRTGKSTTSLKVRGDYIIEDDKIIFTSIPYRTYRNKIKEQLAKNVDIFSEVLEDYEDESALGNNRLVFKVKKGVSHTKVLTKLFKLTDLQATVSYNMNFIVNGTPVLCSLKDLIKSYVEHQINIMIKIATYDRDKAIARAHILKGITIMLQDLDKAIDIIKNADDKADAQNKLIAFFKIDEIQAKAILDITLSRLTKLDRDDLFNELKTQQNIIEENTQIITNTEHRNSVLIKRIIEMRDKYGDERRTKLENIEDFKDDKEIENVIPEKCVVVITESGNIKRVPATALKTQHRATKGIKTQDDITSMVIRTNTVDQLMIFTNSGKMYRLLVDNIPVGDNKTKGAPIRSLVELEPNETVQTIYSIYRETDAKYVLFITKNGIVKKTELKEYLDTKRAKGIVAIKLKEGDSLAAVTLIKEEDIILISRNGMIIRFNSNDIAATGRATTGVKGFNLAEKDYIITGLAVRDNNDCVAVFSFDGMGKKTPIKEIPLQGRGGKGVIISKNTVGAAQLINDTDEVLIIGNKSSICISGSEIPTLSRVASGNIIIKDNHIVSVSKV